MANQNQTGLFSPERMWVIACHTFTQLSRMKVFYFLVVFAVLMIGVNFFELPTNNAGASSAEEHMKMVKNMSFGAMEIFSLLFGISATALLIPKDVEDRTLYTILSKPVPRIDYLFGKLLGVLLIIAVATLVMNALLCAVVYVRSEGLGVIGVQGLIAEELEIHRLNFEREAIGAFSEADYLKEREVKLAELKALGLNFNMQIGVLAVYLKTVIVASVALLLSTFSTSTLFTIIMSVIVWAIGMFQHEAKESVAIFSQFEGSSVQIVKYIIAVIFPDLHLFSITDSATQASAKPIAGKHIASMILLTLMYTGVYSVLSWFVFRKKEF